MSKSSNAESQFDMADLVSVVDAETNGNIGFPHELCNRLRREAPVVKVESGATEPFWMLTRQAEIRQVCSDTERFTSGERLIISTTDPTFEKVRYGDIKPLAALDEPILRKHRAVINPSFLPNYLKANHFDFLQSEVQSLVKETLEKDSDKINISEFGEILSVRAISSFMGLPRETWQTVYDCANAFSAATDPELRVGDTAEESQAWGFTKMSEMFVPLLEERQRDPQSCIVSALANTEVDGEPMDKAYQLSHCMSIFFGGMDTTRNSLTAGMLEFAQSPEQYAMLRADPEGLIDSTIEEILRYVSPVIQFARTATEDVQVGDTLVRAGETLVMVYPSANRDETVFDDPHAFRIDRKPNHHLTFGVGAHNCIGNRFARLQLRTAILELSKHIKELEIIEKPTKYCAFLVPSFKNAKIGIHLA